MSQQESASTCRHNILLAKDDFQFESISLQQDNTQLCADCRSFQETLDKRMAPWKLYEPLAEDLRAIERCIRDRLDSGEISESQASKWLDEHDYHGAERKRKRARRKYDRARILVANERERLLSAIETSSRSHTGMTNTAKKGIQFAERTAVSDPASNAGSHLSKPEGNRRQERFDRNSLRYLAGSWAAAEGQELLNTSGYGTKNWRKGVEAGAGEYEASGAVDLSKVPFKSCLKKPVWARDLMLRSVCGRPMREVI